MLASALHTHLGIFASVQCLVIALYQNHASVTCKAFLSFLLDVIAIAPSRLQNVGACSSKRLAVASEQPAAQGSEERCALRLVNDTRLTRQLLSCVPLGGKQKPCLPAILILNLVSSGQGADTPLSPLAALPNPNPQGLSLPAVETSPEAAANNVSQNEIPLSACAIASGETPTRMGGAVPRHLSLEQCGWEGAAWLSLRGRQKWQEEGVSQCAASTLLADFHTSFQVF